MSKSFTLAATAALTLAGAAFTPAQAAGWEDQAIAPVTNPIFFESPLIQSEIRPLFVWHRLDQGFLGVDADVRVYAVQVRYAVTDRLAVIATKDGFIEIDPNGAPGADGWADIGAGLKYAVVRDDERQLLITPGVTFEFPTGNSRVFQGNGDGEFNLFVSVLKGWDKLHATGLVGGRIPLDMDRETANVRFSGMLDYYLSRWFIPFVAFNAFVTVSEGSAAPFATEGFDLINFGSTMAGGRTQGAVGVGFRSRLRDNLDLGFAYENGVVGSDDIFRDRFTVDMIWRF